MSDREPWFDVRHDGHERYVLMQRYGDGLSDIATFKSSWDARRCAQHFIEIKRVELAHIEAKRRAEGLSKTRHITADVEADRLNTAPKEEP